MAFTIENNEVNHVGVKPAVDQDSIRTYPKIMDGHTPIIKNGYYNNSNGNIHTVTAGKKLQLISLNITAYNVGAGAGIIGVSLRDTVPTSLFFFDYISMPVNSFHSSIYQPAIPMQIPAGYTIYGTSNLAGLILIASIYGYEE